MHRQTTSLVLRDLLAEESLGLELLTGPDGWGDRQVLGAAVVEVEDPTAWLGEQWVLLTAGVRIGETDDAEAGCRALVRDCVRARLAALCFGIGPVFDPLPEALIDEGRACGFPILAVPRTTPFRAVVSFVDDALAAGEAPLFRRLSSLQRYVSDALLDPRPEEAVVKRLARFLDASVMVLRPSGEPEIVVGSPPGDALGRAVAGATPVATELDVDGWHAVMVPIAGATAEPPRWLAIATRGQGFAHRLARPAAETTAPLLGAMARLKELAQQQEAAARSALLDEILEPADPRDAPALAARAGAFGVDFALPARVIVVRDAEAPDEGELSVLSHELAEALARMRAPHLLTRRPRCAAALVQADPAVMRMALDELASGQPDAIVGIGRPVRAVTGVPHSLRDAELAAEPGAGDERRRVRAFEDLDLGTLLLSEARPEWLGPKVDQIIAVLRSRPTMHEALKCWFEHDLDVTAAAAALHLHPNSLRYRLSRLEEALGRNLRSPSTISDLHIALLAERAPTPGPR
jgi:purine catabolism regulator